MMFLLARWSIMLISSIRCSPLLCWHKLRIYSEVCQFVPLFQNHSIRVGGQWRGWGLQPVDNIKRALVWNWFFFMSGLWHSAKVKTMFLNSWKNIRLIFYYFQDFFHADCGHHVVVLHPDHDVLLHSQPCRCTATLKPFSVLSNILVIFQLSWPTRKCPRQWTLPRICPSRQKSNMEPTAVAPQTHFSKWASTKHVS